MVLMLLLAVALAPWYTMKHQVPHSEKKPSLPDIPIAFTGRSDEIQRLIHHVVTEHIGIVSVTGGPGYGKSSVAIVSSHELLRLDIPVYYVSLLEENSIEAFVMAFMHATDRRKKTEQMPQKDEFFSWVSALDTDTVVILDNADLLTLRRTDLRNSFLKLLKDAVAGNSYIHFVVATRYRFKYANDFAEIHLSALKNADALTLLRCVVLPLKQTSNKRDGSLEDENLKGIANRTGGIPLALKVVGELVKSGIVSTAEVLDELAADPLHALSRESFPPDEQLKRCFSLSYKYLSPIMRKCLIYASRFPGTFDRHARDAIITIMTGDAHCLDQLVDRSLVEYSAVEERYTMHSLLRTFLASCVTERPPKHKYYRLFCRRFIHLLSTCITEARTGGEVDHLYTTITVDYHNFLHVLHIYTNETARDHPLVAHKEMLLFANQAFDVMKFMFPWAPLMDWWTAVLKSICRKVDASEFELLAPQFLQLSTKFGNLLLHYKQYQLAEHILLFADQCVSKDIYLAYSFATCQHPQADTYTSMLQALMKVHEEDGLVHKALRVRERLHHCVDSAPDRKPEDLIPDNFCTVGITYLQEKHSQSKHFNSALQLFDAYLKCYGILDEGVNSWIKMLEEAYNYQQYSHTNLEVALGIAKRCKKVRNYRKEADWLMKAVKFMEFILAPLEDKCLILFAIHFRMTYLHWSVFDNAEKALEHCKLAYSLAVKYTHIHLHILKASMRLADMLNQIDGSQSEAGFYFEEALKHFPFLTGNPEDIYAYQKFAELHLVSIHFNAGEHIKCFQHYGQWANLEKTNALGQARKIVNTLFSEPVSANVRSLAVVDSSLDWLLGDVRMARKFLDAFVQKAQDSTVYYAKEVVIILVFCCALAVAFYISMACACFTFFTLLFTQIAYFISMSHFCFHYFLYHALTKKQVWAPRQLPQLHPTIRRMYGITFLLCTVCGALMVGLTSFFGLYLVTEQVVTVYSPSSLYNMSMNIEDYYFYDRLHLP